MKILFLSFYYCPDLGVGSFRSAQLIRALQQQLPEGAHIEVITTQPNRYSSYHISEVPELEEFPGLTIRRIKIPAHKSGLIDQTWSFVAYARQVLRLVWNSDYQLVYGTSSRLMTAALASCIARKKKAVLYLDIRDIFVDGITSVLPKRIVPLAAYFFSLVERWTIRKATKVNLVSEGFREYFLSRYPFQNYSYYTNCIDPVFINEHSAESSCKADKPTTILTVLYAGNIGEGQGLHNIVPALAKRLEKRIQFRLFGDGGRKSQLEEKLAELNCSNVELLPPVSRNHLLAEYQKADVLFIHSNAFDAFKKIIPSKIFEYAATDKPIWAGVHGYAETFIKKEISNVVVFKPCNVKDAVVVFDQLNHSLRSRRREFIEKFSCKSVLKALAGDIIACLPKSC